MFGIIHFCFEGLLIKKILNFLSLKIVFISASIAEPYMRHFIWALLYAKVTNLHITGTKTFHGNETLTLVQTYLTYMFIPKGLCRTNNTSQYLSVMLELNIQPPTILTGKRNATVKFSHVLHVAHKHELHKLTMTRIWSKASGLF